MNRDNKITRRAVATKRRSDKDIISATEQAANGRPNQRYPADKNHDMVDRKYAKYERRRREHVLNNGTRRRSDQHIRRDRETILFLVLSVLGAAFVIIAYSKFTIVLEEEDTFTAVVRTIIDQLPSLSNEKYIQTITNLTTYTIVPLVVEFQEMAPSYFGESFRDVHPKRAKSDSTIIREGKSLDFGGLDLVFPKNERESTTRQIRHDATWMRSDYRDYRTDYMDDDQDNYYAYDDDYVRNPFIESDDEAEQEEIDGYHCRRISEHRLYFPNCNSFHETPLLESQATFIGAGTYRQAMRLENAFGQEQETIVVKDIHFSNDLEYDAYEFTRMDAVVAERLTASPRIYNIYGTCGIGIMSEYFSHGHIETSAIPDDVSFNRTDDEEGPLICYNDFSGLAKLEISLHMAEALADLHGYSGGVIVHQDIKLDQFFLNSNMTGVILNDFNRAEFMLWDEYEEEYCGYREGYGMGNWRSPEEYYDELLNEKVDVFSLGNNMYGLLTGLMVFHEAAHYGEVQHRVGLGEKAYIDPRYKERSLAEAKLIEIIDRCHEYYQEDRPSIFEVVDLLSQALEEVHKDID